MTRLIDAEALKTIKSIQSADFNSIETIRQWIDSAPTIDTIIDIVRCGECKYWKDYECHCESASTDHEGGASYSLDRDANDYCSFGERSEL